MTEHRSADDERTMCSNTVHKKLVVNRFDELINKYFVAHAQQENVQKLAEPTSSTKD